MRDCNKVFCIGLSKTGTKSLDNAFKFLRISAWHYPPPGDFLARTPAIMQRRAFSDINVTDEYKQLDMDYPNSVFILTTRFLPDWLESCDNAFGGEKEAYMRNRYGEDGLTAQIHKRIYGGWGFDEERFTKVFKDHETDVRDYFWNKGGDQLLVMDIPAGDGWEVLCPFLGLDIPEHVPFPHSGKRKE